MASGRDPSQSEINNNDNTIESTQSRATTTPEASFRDSSGYMDWDAALSIREEQNRSYRLRASQVPTIAPPRVFPPVVAASTPQGLTTSPVVAPTHVPENVPSVVAASRPQRVTSSPVVTPTHVPENVGASVRVGILPPIASINVVVPPGHTDLDLSQTSLLQVLPAVATGTPHGVMLPAAAATPTLEQVPCSFSTQQPRVNHSPPVHKAVMKLTARRPTWNLPSPIRAGNTSFVRQSYLNNLGGSGLAPPSSTQRGFHSQGGNWSPEAKLALLAAYEKHKFKSSKWSAIFNDPEYQRHWAGRSPSALNQMHSKLLSGKAKISTADPVDHSDYAGVIDGSPTIAVIAAGEDFIAGQTAEVANLSQVAEDSVAGQTTEVTNPPYQAEEDSVAGQTTEVTNPPPQAEGVTGDGLLDAEFTEMINQCTTDIYAYVDFRIRQLIKDTEAKKDARGRGE